MVLVVGWSWLVLVSLWLLYGGFGYWLVLFGFGWFWLVLVRFGIVLPFLCFHLPVYRSFAVFVAYFPFVLFMFMSASMQYMGESRER